MGTLTDIQIRNWIKARAPVAKSDGDGLTFTLSAGGAASWVLRYRLHGKQRELTLGRYPDTTLSDARLPAVAVATAYFYWRRDILGTIVPGTATLLAIKLGLGW